MLHFDDTKYIRTKHPHCLHNRMNNLMTVEQLKQIHFQISHANMSNKTKCYTGGELARAIRVNHYPNHLYAKEAVGDV